MEKPYSKELSLDTFQIIFPVIAAFAFVVSLILTASSGGDFVDVWHYWVVALLYPILAYTVWTFLRRDQFTFAKVVFIGSHCLFITLLLWREWQPGSVIPYFFAVFIILSSMTNPPHTAFLVWVAAAFLTLLGAGASLIEEGVFSFSYVVQLFAPISINFLLALIAFLSAFEWRFAVESVSELHRKVQRRRDELFAIQAEVQASNMRLKSLNNELDVARQAALNERDLRTRFMNSVSHELRTPLNSIVNFAHILEQGVRGPVNNDQVDYLRRVEQSGWHLLAVLNDLLDMAQIEAGEFKLHLAPANLHPICEEALANVEGLLLDKPVELQRDYPEEWTAVNIDRMRIKQVLINVLGNAAKYTETGYIRLGVVFDEYQVILSIADSGIGIAPEYHDLIFQEFHQIDDTVARHRVGTGLGLPIARHLVERHGGSLSIESDIDQGSQFIVTLPIS